MHPWAVVLAASQGLPCDDRGRPLSSPRARTLRQCMSVAKNATVPAPSFTGLSGVSNTRERHARRTMWDGSACIVAVCSIFQRTQTDRCTQNKRDVATTVSEGRQTLQHHLITSLQTGNQEGEGGSGGATSRETHPTTMTTGTTCTPMHVPCLTILPLPRLHPGHRRCTAATQPRGWHLATRAGPPGCPTPRSGCRPPALPYASLSAACPR
eukprot:scaffold2437_cov395-Prasinococcus_capsulatus_cf.AAC.24